VGRILIVTGVMMVLLGIALTFGERLRLPGDFVFRGRNVTVYFPLATSILLSVVLTLVLWLFNRK
jgi:hypothetical protein